MRLGAVLILMPLVLGAQNAVSLSGTSTAQTETLSQNRSTLQGQVYNAATGEPVGKANLTLRRVDTNPGLLTFVPVFTTTTDAAGHFAMKDIEPGSYSLMAARSGFVPSAYGAKGPGRQGTTIALDQTHSLNDLILRMTPHGVVTGRVVDQDGDPITGVEVQLGRFRYTQGRKKFEIASAASTNDLGEYRIYSVAPGKYYLSVLPQPVFGTSLDRSAAPPSNEDYVRTYYPGTPDISAALQLEVTPGIDLRNQELVLRKERVAKISGRVVNSVTQSPAAVSLIARGRVTELPGFHTAQVDASGKFELRNVPPGSYFVSGGVNHDDRSSVGWEPVEVNGSDIDNLTVTIGPGFQVNGRVRVENDAPFNFGGLRLMLQPREAVGLMGTITGVNVKEDGSFTLEGVNPDRFTVDLIGLPDGFYMKSARAGQVDVLVSGLNLANGAPGDVDVLLSPNAAQLNGMVQSTKTQQLAPGATVVLVPDAPERRDQTEFYRTAASDQTGHFTMKNVVPGKYTVYAWEDVETGAYFDPDFLKSFESWGAKVEVPEGGQLGLQLTLIPAE